MKLDYEKDLDWDNAVVTPLGRFYNALTELGYPQNQILEIIHAITENGVYQIPDTGITEKISA
jgi:Holliday junction resolvasome RuvABC DNA-binding subunit